MCRLASEYHNGRVGVIATRICIEAAKAGAAAHESCGLTVNNENIDVTPSNMSEAIRSRPTTSDSPPINDVLGMVHNTDKYADSRNHRLHPRARSLTGRYVLASMLLIGVVYGIMLPAAPATAESLLCSRARELVRTAAINEGVPENVMGIELVRQTATSTITRYSVSLTPVLTPERLYHAITESLTRHGFTIHLERPARTSIMIVVRHQGTTCVEVLCRLAGPLSSSLLAELAKSEDDAKDQRASVAESRDTHIAKEEVTPEKEVPVPSAASDLESVPPVSLPPYEESVLPGTEVDSHDAHAEKHEDMIASQAERFTDMNGRERVTEEEISPKSEESVIQTAVEMETLLEESDLLAPLELIEPDVVEMPEVKETAPILAEGEALEGELVEREVAEGETSEGDMPEGEALEGEALEGEALEGEALEGEAVEGEALEGEALDEDSDVASGPAKIAIILDDGGYGGIVTGRVLELDNRIALAILPDTPFAQSTVTDALAKGFEIMLHMPMQNSDRNNAHTFPGELTLEMTREEIQERTRECIAQFPDAVGVNNHTGGAFTADEKRIGWFLDVVKEHNWFFVDSRTTGRSRAYDAAVALGIPCACRDIFLDNSSDPDEIRHYLNELIARARKKGYAVGIGHFRPNTVSVLEEELPKLESRNVSLVRISEVVR